MLSCIEFSTCGILCQAVLQGRNRRFRQFLGIELSKPSARPPRFLDFPRMLGWCGNWPGITASRPTGSANEGWPTTPGVYDAYSSGDHPIRRGSSRVLCGYA